MLRFAREMLFSNGTVMLSNAYLYLVSVDTIFVVFIGGWYVLHSAISVNDWLADKLKGWRREETSGFRLKFPSFPTKP